MIEEMPVSKYEENIKHCHPKMFTPTCHILINGIVPYQVHKFNFLGSVITRMAGTMLSRDEHEKHFILEMHIT